MKQRLKGLLALVLSLVMVFALATNAWAVVRIGGVEMGDGTTTTYYYNGTNGAQGSTSDTDTGNWNAKVERINGVQTLTLNNFTMVDNSHYEAISSDQDLTLNLIGDNEITASYLGSSGVVVAVSVTGKLAIEGTGSLNADGTDSGLSASSGVDISGGKVTAEGDVYGIISSTGNVTITGGEVEATGRNSGINANNITISGGTVTATGSNDNGYGIYALEDNFNGGDITISNGNVTAEGGRVGIGAEDAVTITGGTVIAKGTTPTDSVGIHASGRLGGELTITGATVTATGGEYGINSSFHTGSSSGGEVVIKNSTVTAKAGADGTGIRVEGVIGKTIIQNSTVDIGCKTGINSNYVAILADSSVTIKSTDKAISCSGLSFADATDPALSDSTWYKWSTDNTNFTDSATTELTKEITADTSTLYVVPLSANTNPYPPIIYNPTPTPEPEKVDSAKTFDGGIGLYVTMSILSATGGAWLAKKKD